MTKDHDLLSSIAEELEIQQDRSESAKNWKARVLYSTLGRMAYASLFDDEEETSIRDSQRGFVSITHFERRIDKVFSAYSELYPDVSSFFFASAKELSKEIFDIFQKTGCLYCRPYRVAASVPCAAIENGIRFERGMPLCRSQSISGLGGYTNADKISEFSKIFTTTLIEMFGLPSSTLEDQWKLLLSQAKWQFMQNPFGMQYLRERPPFREKYWVPDPNQTREVSISRIKQSGNYTFFLYRFSQGRLMVSQIPLWIVHDPHFGFSLYHAANCCLAAHHSLPAVRYHSEERIVWLDFQYLLPPAELYWIKLYSWPQSQSNRNFHRIMSTPVFYAVKPVLERIGYSFLEV